MVADSRRKSRNHQFQILHDLINRLQHTKSPCSNDSWHPLHRYLTSHSDISQLQSSILQPYSSSRSLSNDGTTALHLICKHSPPTNVIRACLDVCPEAFHRADSLGRLPLHYACHHGCNADVLEILIGAHPDGCLEGDTLGRTPLHFAVGDGSKKEGFGAETVELLVESGAASTKDSKHMLPLHYACAYGATPEVLQVLITAHPPSITAQDSNNLTPLHYVCGNCERPASPLALDFLLSINPNLVNVYANDYDMGDVIGENIIGERQASRASLTGASKMSILSTYIGQQSRSHHPLHALAHRASNFKPSSHGDFPYNQNVDYSKQNDCARTNAQRCLYSFLNHNPQSTPDFLTALQALPKWLRDHAVVHPTVKKLLNESMAHRIPTAVIMLDLYAHMTIIVTYFLLVIQSIDNRHDSPDDDASVSPTQLIPMYIGALYFTLRHTLKILSFLSLHLLHALVQHEAMSNTMDLLYLALTYFWAVVLTSRGLNEDYFRWGAAFTLLYFWVILLKFLRNLRFDFAVFVNGVLHVLSELRTFLSVTCMMLMAFMQMFYTLFLSTDSCKQDTQDGDSGVAMARRNMYDVGENEPVCPAPTESEFCTQWEAFLAVFTMLLGEVDAGHFESSKIASYLFVVFVFICVILLANVLIAIVTDSYGVIRNERAAMVFWSYRLAFVIQMNVICSGVWKEWIACLFCGAPTDERKVNTFDDNDDTPFHSAPNRTHFSSRAASTSSNNRNNGIYNNSGKTTVFTSNSVTSDSTSSDMFSNLWINLLEFVNEDFTKKKKISRNNDRTRSGGLMQSHLVSILLRLVTVFVIIPFWIALGLVTAGWVWPPQVRKKILQESDHVGDSGFRGGSEDAAVSNAANFGVSEPERRKIEVECLRKDVEELKANFGIEMVKNREMIKEMRGDLMSARSELSHEVKDIKKIMLRFVGLQRTREKKHATKDRLRKSGKGIQSRAGSVGISSSMEEISRTSDYMPLSVEVNDFREGISISSVDINVGENESVSHDEGKFTRSGSRYDGVSEIDRESFISCVDHDVGKSVMVSSSDAEISTGERTNFIASLNVTSEPVSESMSLSTGYDIGSEVRGDTSTSVVHTDVSEDVTASGTGISYMPRPKGINFSDERPRHIDENIITYREDDASNYGRDNSVSATEICEQERHIDENMITCREDDASSFKRDNSIAATAIGEQERANISESDTGASTRNETRKLSTSNIGSRWNIEDDANAFAPHTGKPSSSDSDGINSSNVELSGVMVLSSGHDEALNFREDASVSVADVDAEDGVNGSASDIGKSSSSESPSVELGRVIVLSSTGVARGEGVSVVESDTEIISSSIIESYDESEFIAPSSAEAIVDVAAEEGVSVSASDNGTSTNSESVGFNRSNVESRGVRGAIASSTTGDIIGVVGWERSSVSASDTESSSRLDSGGINSSNVESICVNGIIHSTSTGALVGLARGGGVSVSDSDTGILTSLEPVSEDGAVVGLARGGGVSVSDSDKVILTRVEPVLEDALKDMTPSSVDDVEEKKIVSKPTGTSADESDEASSVTRGSA